MILKRTKIEKKILCGRVNVRAALAERSGREPVRDRSACWPAKRNDTQVMNTGRDATARRTSSFTAEQGMPPVTILHGPSLLLVMLI
jgi:hypothetical protein